MERGHRDRARGGGARHQLGPKPLGSHLHTGISVRRVREPLLGYPAREDRPVAASGWFPKGPSGRLPDIGDLARHTSADGPRTQSELCHRGSIGAIPARQGRSRTGRTLRANRETAENPRPYYGATFTSELLRCRSRNVRMARYPSIWFFIFEKPCPSS